MGEIWQNEGTASCRYTSLVQAAPAKRNCGAVVVVQVAATVLRLWHEAKNKVLFFTQGRLATSASCRTANPSLSCPEEVSRLCACRLMLDVVESYVQSMGYSYLRMDGTTPIKQVGWSCHAITTATRGHLDCDLRA